MGVGDVGRMLPWEPKSYPPGFAQTDLGKGEIWLIPDTKVVNHSQQVCKNPGRHGQNYPELDAGGPKIPKQGPRGTHAQSHLDEPGGLEILWWGPRDTSTQSHQVTAGSLGTPG